MPRSSALMADFGQRVKAPSTRGLGDKQCKLCPAFVIDNRATYCPPCGEMRIREHDNAEAKRARSRRAYEKVKQLRASTQKS